MPLPGLSVAAVALKLTAAAVDQLSEPPLTAAGAVGTVRSIFTVFEAAALAGVPAEALPAASVPRNCTSVWPSLTISADDPATAVDQVPPLSVEVRYW